MLGELFAITNSKLEKALMYRNSLICLFFWYLCPSKSEFIPFYPLTCLSNVGSKTITDIASFICSFVLVLSFAKPGTCFTNIKSTHSKGILYIFCVQLLGISFVLLLHSHCPLGVFVFFKKYKVQTFLNCRLTRSDI